MEALAIDSLMCTKVSVRPNTPSAVGVESCISYVLIDGNGNVLVVLISKWEIVEFVEPGLLVCQPNLMT